MRYFPDRSTDRQSCSRPNCPTGPYAHTIGTLPDGAVVPYETAFASHGRTFHRCTAGRLIAELAGPELADLVGRPALHALAGNPRQALENYLAAGGTIAALEAHLAAVAEAGDRTATAAFHHNRGELAELKAELGADT